MLLKVAALGCQQRIAHSGGTGSQEATGKTGQQISLMGAYSWLDKGGNPYPRGEGTNPIRDYAFKVYMCPR